MTNIVRWITRGLRSAEVVDGIGYRLIGMILIGGDACLHNVQRGLRAASELSKIRPYKWFIVAGKSWGELLFSTSFPTSCCSRFRDSDTYAVFDTDTFAVRVVCTP